MPEGGWATSSVELKTHLGATGGGGGVEELPYPAAASGRINAQLAHAAWARLMAREVSECVLAIPWVERRVKAVASGRGYPSAGLNLIAPRGRMDGAGGHSGT